MKHLLHTTYWAKRQGLKKFIFYTATGQGSCPLACRYCFLSKSGPLTVMEWNTLQRAIDFLAAFAVSRPTLHFFGTEPTAQWDLIVKAREYAPGFPISLTTNGYLLDDVRIKWLNENDVKVYVYSLDGGPEHNKDRITYGGQASWTRVASNLKKLTATKQRSWLTARGTWDAPAADYDLLGRIRALTDLGARSVQIVPVVDGAVEWDEEQVCQAYIEVMLHYGLGMTPSKYINEMLARVAEEKDADQVGNKCGTGYGTWAVEPNGSLVLCQTYQGKARGKIGDVWDGIGDSTPFTAVSERVNWFHSKVKHPKPECKGCHAYKHCMGVGWCAGLNYACTGDELIPPDNYCRHLRGMVSAMREVLGCETKTRVCG